MRVFDKVFAPRDNAWLLDRKKIAGMPANHIKEHFAPRFVPRYICDAKVPIGESVTMRMLTNGQGKVTFFRADTRLLLANERPI